MQHPRIKTMTIDSHDNTKPMKWRLVEIDGQAHFVAMDICPFYGLQPDADGDYRSALAADGVEYKESLIDNLGEIIGPVTLITQAGHDLLTVAAIKRTAKAV